MQPVHHYVADAQSIHGRRQLGGKVIAVHVNHKRRFGWVVQALAYADAEKSRILAHQVGGGLILDSPGLRQNGGGERRNA